MEANISVSMDNAAFTEMPASELARILRQLADSIEQDGATDLNLRDINGNKTGRFVVTENGDKLRAWSE